MQHLSPAKKIAILLGLLPILLCIAVITALTLPVVLAPTSDNSTRMGKKVRTADSGSALPVTLR
jgi:hypothetical protein